MGDAIGCRLPTADCRWIYDDLGDPFSMWISINAANSSYRAPPESYPAESLPAIDPAANGSGRPICAAQYVWLVGKPAYALRRTMALSNLAKDTVDQLVEAVQRLSKADSLDELIQIVKKAARQVTEADGASFVLRDGDRCYYVDEDAIEPLWKGRRFPMDACISGWVMHNRQAVVIPDVFADDRIPHDVYRQTFVRSMAMVPIRSLAPLGAIGVYWSDGYCPMPQTVRWLQSLADAAALGIEHVNARSEVRDLRTRTALLRKENRELRHEKRERERPRTVTMCFVTKQVEVEDGDWICLESFLEECLGLDVKQSLSPQGRGRL